MTLRDDTLIVRLSVKSWRRRYEATFKLLQAVNIAYATLSTFLEPLRKPARTGCCSLPDLSDASSSRSYFDNDYEIYPPIRTESQLILLVAEPHPMM